MKKERLESLWHVLADLSVGTFLKYCWITDSGLISWTKNQTIDILATEPLRHLNLTWRQATDTARSTQKGIGDTVLRGCFRPNLHYQNFEQQKEPDSAVIAAEIECRTTKRVRVQEGVSNLHIALSWFAFGNESLCTRSFKRQRPGTFRVEK